MTTRQRKSWMAQPRRSYEVGIVRDAALILVVIWLVVVASAAGYQ